MAGRRCRANLARNAGGGDRDVARDILADICDIGIANSYYVGLMRSGEGGQEQQPGATPSRSSCRPSPTARAPTSTSAASAVAKHAPNKANAVKLSNSSCPPEAQTIYAKANFEYPVRTGAEIDPIIASLGDLKIDPLPLHEIGAHRKEASELVDKVGFDQQM